MKGRVLVIAGSDSGGGAGIQADIKTITALGGYAMTAITALTAQNTRGVAAVEAVRADFVRAQIDAVLDDLGADAVKTGMLNSADIVLTVADAIKEKAAGKPLVLDPVMVATSGDALAETDLKDALIDRLLPRAALVTPNIPEAEALTGLEITGEDGMRDAARALRDQGAEWVLLKGGHLEGDELLDLLAGPEAEEVFRSARIESRNTHGTGCTLASAIACGLAQDRPMRDAVIRAREYVRLAIERAPGYGGGHGPLNHPDAGKNLA